MYKMCQRPFLHICAKYLPAVTTVTVHVKTKVNQLYFYCFVVGGVTGRVSSP